MHTKVSFKTPQQEIFTNTPIFFFFDPVRYVTNGIGKFSLGGRILIVPKPKEYLMQRANSKMQISVIYLYTQLLIIKLEFRQVLEEKQSHYFMVQHLLYSFSSLSTREKKTKPLECVHLIFDLFPSYSQIDPMDLTNTHEKKKNRWKTNTYSKYK